MVFFFSDLTPGQTVKKVVTRTEVHTLRTVDGKVVEDSFDPGNTQTTVERYTFDNRAVNGNTPVVTKQYIPGDEYRSGRRGPGSHSSVEDYRRPYSPGSQGGYSSGDGRRTPTANNPSGNMSDGYQTPTGM